MSALHTAGQILRYQIRDVVRSRWLIGYVAFFALATDALLRFGGADARSLLSLMNVVLLVVPLVALVFGTMYVYHAREFVELLLAQPVGRRELFVGLSLGLAAPLAAGFAVGLGAPVMLHAGWNPALFRAALTLLATGIALVCVFTAVALYLAVRIDDRVRGLGAAVALWLGFAVLYDGLVLVASTMLADFAVERPLLALMMLNPIDLARVLLLLQFDVSALMGYTGAVFASAFGGTGGRAVAAATLAVWIAVPTWLGARAFQRKSF
jgi:Cu-processing system permease protein